MNGIELRALSEIEQYWHRHGCWPKRFLTKDFKLEESLQKESFMRGLFNRGITPPANNHEEKLTDAQFAAIMVVVDIHDKRTISSKLKSIGVSSQTWNGWLRGKFFKDYLHRLSSNNFEAALHIAQEGLLRSVERGDVNAIKYYNQLTGREVSQETQSARIIVGRILQVIQTHIKDEALLMAIARDFDKVMRGEEPSPVVLIDRVI